MSENDQTGLPAGAPGWLVFYVKLRQWFQPYYRYTGKVKIKSTGQKSTPKTQTAKKQVAKKQAQRQEPVQEKAPIPPFTLVGYPARLDNVMNFKKLPSPGHVYAYHDGDRHQVIGHFVPGSGMLYKTRDNAARGRLDPLIYPTNDDGSKLVFDRTHLIPIGYHGSENDPRLLIGWDSKANRGPFQNFESKQKKRKKPIYWVTDVRRTPTGAHWSYRVYDAETRELLDELEHEMNTRFVWRV